MADRMSNSDRSNADRSNSDRSNAESSNPDRANAEGANGANARGDSAGSNGGGLPSGPTGPAGSGSPGAGAGGAPEARAGGLWSGHPELDDDPGPRSFPSNVSELLTRAQLDNARDVFKLVETRSDLSPYQERELAVKIIQKLAAFHEDVIDGLISEEKAESVAAWAMDLNRIRVAISLLEAVELSDD